MVVSAVAGTKSIHVPAAYGEPPKEWTWARLDDVSEGVFDCPHSTPKLTAAGPFVVRTQDIITGVFRTDQAGRVSEETYVERISRVTPSQGDLLYSREGTYFGIAAEVPPNTRVCLGQRMVLIRPDKQRLDFKFLRYWLNSPIMAAHIHGYRDGSVAERLNLPTIRALPILLPPLAEQKAIATALGALDDKIELNRRMNMTLEALARALFQSWFVDFDPVRAKLDGRPSGTLDPEAAALFPSSFDETEFGHIPHGWQVKTIDELAERVAIGPFGSDIKVSTFVSEGIPVISGQHLHGTLLNDSEFNFVSIEHADRLKRSNVQRGDVIFTHAGSIGQVAYIPDTSRYERYIVSQRQFYMRCHRSMVSPFYITSYFKTPEGQHRLLANTSSTGVPSISQPVTYLRQLKMVVPPPSLLKIFDDVVGPIHLKMADNEQQTRCLGTLRDALLPELLSGKVTP